MSHFTLIFLRKASRYLSLLIYEWIVGQTGLFSLGKITKPSEGKFGIPTSCTLSDLVGSLCFMAYQPL